MIKKDFFRFPLLNVFVAFAIAIIMGTFIFKTELDNDLSKMMSQDNPSIEAFRQTEKLFGSSNVMVIGFRAKEGTIFTPEYLKILEQIGEEAKNICYLKSKSDSAKQKTPEINGDLEDLLGDFETLEKNHALDESTAQQASEMEDLLGDFENSTASMTVAVKDASDKAPPAIVTNVLMTQKKNLVEISWTDPADEDLDYIEMIYKTARTDDKVTVKKGKQIAVAKDLNYDEAYSFILTAVDINGNRSAPVKKKLFVGIEDGLQMVDSVLSIVDASSIQISNGELKIEELKKPSLPQNQEEMEAFKKKLYSWELYDTNLISPDQKSAAIYLNLTSGLKNQHFMYFDNELQKIIKKYETENIEVYQSGTPTLMVKVSEYMINDLVILIPLVSLVVLLTLYLSFAGKIGGVVLPMICVAISTVASIGLMGMLGKKIDIVSTAIPVGLIAISSAYGIHVMTHYYDALRRRENITQKEHKELIFQVLREVGSPVLLAGLTTAAGFLSFTFAPVESLRNYGLFTAFGVLAALVVAVFFIPSMLLLRRRIHLKQRKVEDSTKKRKTRHYFLEALYSIYIFFMGKTYRMVALLLGIILLSFIGINRIVIDSQVIEYFKKSSPVQTADRYLCENFAGTNFLDITVIGPEPGSLANPEIIDQMDQLAQFLVGKYPQIKKTMGYPDFIKKMNQVMNSDGSEDQNKIYYEIPKDIEKYRVSRPEQLNELITQYLLLLGEDVTAYVTGEDPLAPNAARITLLMTSSASAFTKSLIKDVKQFAEENLPKSYQCQVSGTADFVDALNSLVIESQIQSIILSAFMVLLIIILKYRSLVAGVIGIAPLGLAILLNFGMMGIFGITLNIATAIIASVAIGMGVDYTIHFLAAYKLQRMKSDNLREITKNTLMTSGNAIISNTSAVCLGFFIMVFSNFVPLVNVGLMLSCVMITSSLGAMVLLPVLLGHFDPKFLRK